MRRRDAGPQNRGEVSETRVGSAFEQCPPLSPNYPPISPLISRRYSRHSSRVRPGVLRRGKLLRSVRATAERGQRRSSRFRPGRRAASIAAASRSTPRLVASGRTAPNPRTRLLNWRVPAGSPSPRPDSPCGALRALFIRSAPVFALLPCYGRLYRPDPMGRDHPFCHTIAKLTG
jgi:hypothetical protein